MTLVNRATYSLSEMPSTASSRLLSVRFDCTGDFLMLAAIAASIKEWGWTSPALVGEDGGLIAGHARILAARQLGIAEIPVMVAAGWTEAQKRAYVLADNQLAITGSGWDPELLRLELGELKLSGFDLSLTGFGDLELKDLLAERTEGA